MTWGSNFLRLGWVGTFALHLAQLTTFCCSAEETTNFEASIRPIFRDHCEACHGANKQEGGLRLHGKQSFELGGDSGPVIVSGRPQESEIWRRVVSANPAERMPPEGDPLTAAEIETLRAWIAAGAAWPEDASSVTEMSHWAFVPPVRPRPPSADSAEAIANPIDAFVVERLTRVGLSLSAEADRHALLRRLHLDLTGLGPTPEEVRRFVEDTTDDAYQNLVERLLGVPQFGERWALPWLDMARYADSDGYEKDLPRPNAYRWRDWVIDAINRDLPFDEFTVQQIAGDLLPGASEEVRLATGFHRNTLTNREGGVDQEEFRVKAVVDRLNTVFTVWMGLTVGCAECHSHKYDPISQREFYQLFAFFNNADEEDRPAELSAKERVAYEAALASHQAKMKELEEKLVVLRPAVLTRLLKWEELQQQRDVAWSPLQIEALNSPGTTQLVALEDGVVSASGPLRPRTDYVLQGSVPLSMFHALRIEALTEEELPGLGPGRGGGGAFELSHLKLEVATGPTATEFQYIPLVNARSLENLSDVSPSEALEPTRQGWRGEAGKSATIIFEIAAQTVQAGWLGNEITAANQDGATAMLNVYHQSPFPAVGQVEVLRFFTRAAQGSDAGLYLLRPDGEGGFRVIYHETFQAKGEDGLVEYRLPTPWQVQRGDLFAHSGNGGPGYFGNPKNEDQLYYPLERFPKAGEELLLEKYPHFSEKREYILQAHFEPRVASPEVHRWPKDQTSVRLRIRLSHASGERSLGKFRVSFTDVDDPLGLEANGDLPGEILKVVKQSRELRTQQEQQTLLEYFESIDATAGPVRKQLNALQQAPPRKPRAIARVMQQRALPRSTYVHRRGNFLDRGVEVQPQTPVFLQDLRSRGADPDRLDLARWIASAENPLTARVAVNHVWAQLFGRGLVRTTEDFGTQGESPSHPQLLDWLATEFVANDWSRKELIKLIVMSNTYRQRSTSHLAEVTVDLENTLLSRQNRYRLPAQLVRDQYLHAAHILNPQVGGPSFRPPLPAGTAQIQFTNQWTPDTGDVLHRRGVYIHLQRNLLLPMLVTFDQPDSIISCTRRDRSNTPLQALTLLNDPTFFAAAKVLGGQVGELGHASLEKGLDALYLATVCRLPTAYERSRMQALYHALKTEYERDPEAAQQLVNGSIRTKSLLVPEAAAWVAMARTVLNLDEVITRE